MAKAITREEFKNRIKERFPNEEFELLEYTTASNPSKIKCKNCNKILEPASAKNFLIPGKIAGCPYCKGLYAKSRKNLELLQEKYKILKQEKEARNGIWYTCECKKCGRVSKHKMPSFLYNSCRCEGKGNHWTEKEIIEYLKQNYGQEYVMVSPFKTVNDKTLFRHSCGFIWSTTPSHILYNKTGCPRCSKLQSKGSKIIEKYLKQFNINYEKEKFLNNSLQRFDFYFELNNKKYAVEYNGEQHYKYNPFFHGRDIETFKKYQERDKRKAKYCLENNIILTVMPYTFKEDDIKKCLEKLFSSSTTILSGVASSDAKKCSSI